MPEETTPASAPDDQRMTPADDRPRIRGVIIDWGGVMTNPILDTVDAWIRAEQIDRDTYTAVMRAWVTQAMATGPTTRSTRWSAGSARTRSSSSGWRTT